MLTIPLINKFTCSPRQLNYFIHQLNNKQILPILDYINENKDSTVNNIKVLSNLITQYPNNYIAIKCSSLNIEKHEKLAYDTICTLVEKAIDNNSKILIDAEHYLIQDKIDHLTDNLLVEFNKTNTHVYKTYQMYRQDSLAKFKQDLTMDRDYKLGIKLVRGAYYNQDYKYNILYDNIEDTHKNYNNAIQTFVDYSNHTDTLMLATHNKDSIRLAESFLTDPNIHKPQFEFAQLLGIADHLTQDLANKHFKVFKYLPYGEFNESIPYLLRRLNENKLILTNLFY